jgi:hypothetical protein
MSHTSKTVIVVLMIAMAGSIAALLGIYYHRYRRSQPIALTLKGAVLVSSADVDKQVPIPGVNISVAGDQPTPDTWSTSTGFFQLRLPKPLGAAQWVILQFRHPQYQPVDLPVSTNDRLYVVRMIPVEQPAGADASLAHVAVSNITVRYTIKTTTPLNVGSFVKTFRVVNAGNVPCNGRSPCSPDGKWKAALGSATFEAPGGNVFSKARLSCIAGPCPFTSIRSDGFSGGGPTVSMAVLNWSDTTTFLFEAELLREMISDSVRVSYPLIFGQTVHFTVPADAEGVCIEADLNREHIVFPLGPEPRLSWASCTALVDPDHTNLYRCELKPGYGLK